MPQDGAVGWAESVGTVYKGEGTLGQEEKEVREEECVEQEETQNISTPASYPGFVLGSSLCITGHIYTSQLSQDHPRIIPVY